MSPKKFFIETFGGPAPSGSSHELVRLDGDQFAAVLLHIYDVLVSLGLPESLKERLILAVLSRVVS